jgi:hypothetical protein
VLEKAGIHKRDILVDRVEEARDSQAEAQEQFQSALEQFNAVVTLQETDLSIAYDRMKAAFDDSQHSADEVSQRINRVESVAEDLFEEWEEELKLYQSAELRRSSERTLRDTRGQYARMISKMRQAEEKMAPVLALFRDNVLYLKHNLNAQAIGSLRDEFSSLQGKIQRLIADMNRSIEASNDFIANLQ